MMSRGRGSIQILDMYCDLEKDTLSNVCVTGFQSGSRNTQLIAGYMIDCQKL